MWRSIESRSASSLARERECYATRPIAMKVRAWLRLKESILCSLNVVEANLLLSLESVKSMNELLGDWSNGESWRGSGIYLLTSTNSTRPVWRNWRNGSYLLILWLEPIATTIDVFLIYDYLFFHRIRCFSLLSLSPSFFIAWLLLRLSLRYEKSSYILNFSISFGNFINLTISSLHLQ